MLLAALAVPAGLVLGGRTAAATLGVSVSGNHLVDGSGNPLMLRGADVSGTEFACIQGGTQTSRGWSINGGQPIDQASTYQAMAAWHINVVRVPLNEDCWLGINGVNPAYGGAKYQAAIRTEVDQINAAGMIAILDLHWTSPGPYAAYAQNSMADTDHSITFWQQVAAAYKSDPAVIYDLFNEPFFYYIADGTDQWSCWLNGCEQSTVITAGQLGPNGQSTGYTTSYSWRSAGMNQLVAAVRSTGATQPILANGVDWANDDSGWLSHEPTDPAGQLIAGWHSYPGQGCSPQSCWNANIAPITATVPVLVGETGDNTSTTPTYMPTFLPWADQHGVSYLAWTWNPWQYGSNVLIQDWNGTPTSGEGAYYKNHLLSVAGAPTGTGTTTTTAPSTTSSSSTSTTQATTTTTQGTTTSTTGTTTTTTTTTTTNPPPPGPGIAQVGPATTFSSPNTSSPRTALPAGTTGGDLLVTQIETPGNGVTVTCPTGWTKVLRVSNWTNLAVCETVAGNSQVAPVATVSPGGQVSMITMAFSGVNASRPIDASSGRAGGTSPSVATTVPNDLLILLEGNSGWNTVSTAPAGTTPKAAVNDGQASQTAIAAVVATTAGPTPPKSWTVAGGSSVVAATVAIAPAA